MQFRIVHSVLAISLAAFIALPAVADEAGATAEFRTGGTQLQSATSYDAGMTVAGPSTTTLLPDERDEPLRWLALVGPAVAISVLTILGLTITFSALRRDMRQRRVVYRQRGHRMQGRPL